MVKWFYFSGEVVSENKTKQQTTCVTFMSCDL